MSDNKPKGRLTIQTVAMPANTNSNGDIFGGWLVSHMDMAAGIESRRRAKSRAVTVSIDKMIFMKPVNVGDTVSVYCQLTDVGRTSMTFKVCVWTISLNEPEKKVAEGIFKFVAIDDEGKPQLVDRD